MRFYDKKDITPRDKKSRPHGEWIEYNIDTGKINKKSNHHHGYWVGLWVWYNYDGKPWIKEYYI